MKKKPTITREFHPPFELTDAQFWAFNTYREGLDLPLLSRSKAEHQLGYMDPEYRGLFMEKLK